MDKKIFIRNKVFMPKSYIVAFITFAMFFFISQTSYSQSVWIHHGDKERKSGVEFVIPSFESSFFEAPTSVLFFYSRFTVLEKFDIVVDLPLSHLSTEDIPGFGNTSTNSTAVGNPYIGIEADIPQSNFTVDAGIRIPVAPDDNSGLTTGQLVESLRLEAFIPKTFAIKSNLNYERSFKSDFIVKAGGGFNIIFPDDAETEGLFQYYSQLLYNIDVLTFGGGLTGQVLFSEDGLSIEERSLHKVGIIAAIDFSPFSTGVYYYTPLDDDLSDILNSVIGFNFTFGF